MSRWRRFIHRGSLERELDAELRDHLDRQVADYVRAGASPADARRRATLEFGGLEQTKELCRDARGTRLIEETITDARYAVRTLVRRPGFTLAALLLLALGIGANAAIFSLLEAVLFREVSVASPGDLFFVHHSHGDRSHAASNYPLYERVRVRDDVFAGVTAYSLEAFKVSNGGDVERVDGEYVAGNYHALLGVPLAIGRGFVSEDDRPSARESIAVISHRFWTRAFNRAPDIVGRTLTVDGRAVSIVGVTAPAFEGLTPGRLAEITLPLSVKAAASADYLTMHDTWTSLTMVARLKGGIAEAQATRVLDGVFRQYVSEPENQWYKLDSASLVAAGRGSAGLRQRYAPALTVLMAMAIVVLVIASANFAYLQLARAGARTKEMSIRLSIGAGRGRVIRQLVTESLVLAVMGGAAGLLLALWGTATIASFFREGVNPVVLDVRANATVLGFTAATALGMGLLFGLTPAFAATRLDLVSALKGAPASSGRGLRWNLRRSMVAGQVALCLLLVTGAGLLVQTLRNLQARDGSVDGRGVWLYSLDGRRDELSAEQWPTVCAQLLTSISTRPDLEAGACSTSTPFDLTESRRGAAAGSTPIPGGVLANVVNPGFFKAFGIPLLRGRAFTELDVLEGEKVAVVSETMAHIAFGDANPLGRTFNFRASPKEQIRIVGVVRDVRHNPREGVAPAVYTPLGQGGEIEQGMTLSVRLPNAPAQIADAVRSTIRAANADLIVGQSRTYDEHVGGVLVRERALALLSSWFGTLALVLACIGLYSVLAQNVTLRRREIGIRLALGASPSRVLGAVMRDAAVIAAAGIVIGTVASLMLAKAISGLLFDVSARDPLIVAAAAVLLAATTLLAGFLPARRAAHVDPTLVLRSE